MFASLLRSKKRRPSETTPLLAALDRYRNRRNGVEETQGDAAEGVAQYEGDEEGDEDEDQQRDGPLLPVFSSTFLGMSSIYSLFTVLTNTCRSSSHLQHHPRRPYITRPTMRDHALLGPAALATGLAVLGQANPAADPLRPFLARHSILSTGELSAVQEGERGEPWKHGSQ